MSESPDVGCREGAAGASIFDYPIARRMDQYDRMAYAFADLGEALARIEDETGISLPPIQIWLTHRHPVHDLPMEFDPAYA